MAQRRTSVAMKEQVLSLNKQVAGKRAIAKALGLSKNTVKKILSEFASGKQSCNLQM